MHLERSISSFTHTFRKYRTKLKRAALCPKKFRWIRLGAHLTNMNVIMDPLSVSRDPYY